MKHERIVKKLKNGLSVKVPDVWDKLKNAPLPRDSTAESVRRTARVSLRKLAAAAVAFVFVLALVIGVPLITHDPDTGASQAEFMSLLSIKAYAASSGTEGTEMQPGATVLLGSYSPLMSSVPGYPFEFSYSDAQIRLMVDHGQLLTWNEEGDFKVNGVGQSYTIDGSGKIYWSPFSDNSTGYESIEAANLSFEVAKDGIIVGKGRILIQNSDENSAFYSAELITVAD